MLNSALSGRLFAKVTPVLSAGSRSKSAGPTGALDLRLPAKQFHVGNGELMSVGGETSRGTC